MSRKIGFILAIFSLAVLSGCATVSRISYTPRAITRAQVAKHLVDRLKIDKKLEVKIIIGDASFKPAPSILDRAARKPEISDISKLTKKEQLYVKKVVELGVMELFPDGTFRPYESITRGDFAVILQKIMVDSLGDRRLSTKFIGSTSPFPDVDSSHYAFNAAMLLTTRGVMKAKLNGEFGLNDFVSGEEAIDGIKRLKPLL